MDTTILRCYIGTIPDTWWCNLPFHSCISCFLGCPSRRKRDKDNLCSFSEFLFSQCTYLPFSSSGNPWFHYQEPAYWMKKIDRIYGSAIGQEQDVDCRRTCGVKKSCMTGGQTNERTDQWVHSYGPLHAAQEEHLVVLRTHQYWAYDAPGKLFMRSCNGQTNRRADGRTDAWTKGQNSPCCKGASAH